MKIKHALQNPFVLVAQGFIVGAAIFLATMPAEDANAGAGAVKTAALAEKLGA